MVNPGLFIYMYTLCTAVPTSSFNKHKKSNEIKLMGGLDGIEKQVHGWIVTIIDKSMPFGSY